MKLRFSTVYKNSRKRCYQNNFEQFRPQLTSFIDVMTILLIYLLKGFSTDANTFVPSADLQVPHSSSQEQAVPTVVLTVSTQYIMIQDKVLMAVDSIIQDRDVLIDKLDSWLEKRRIESQKIGLYADKKIFEGKLTIFADKRIPFGLLKPILYTCGRQQFTDVYLMVERSQ